MWRRWVALTSRTEDGLTQALFRIAVGLCLLGTVGTVVAHGLVEVIWIDVEHGGYRSLGKRAWLIDALGGPTPGVIWSVVAASLLSGTALVLGLGGRVTALVAAQSWLALNWVNGHTGGSYDELLSNALWLVVLSSNSKTLSLDCKLRTGSWTTSEAISSWPRYLTVLQLVIVYASTGFQKLSAHWTPVNGYSALYYILQQPSWHRTDMSFLAWIYPLTQAATALTWLWEVTSPFLLVSMWLRMHSERGGKVRQWLAKWDYRKLFTIIGVGVHVGIELAMNVGPFSYISLAFYVALWAPDEWRRLPARLRPGQRYPAQE